MPASLRLLPPSAAKGVLALLSHLVEASFIIKLQDTVSTAFKGGSRCPCKDAKP